MLKLLQESVGLVASVNNVAAVNRDRLVAFG